MAHDARPTLDALDAMRGPLSERIAADGGALRLTFYAALRRIECMFRDAPRFGVAVDPALEPLRFGQDPSLAFRPSALTSVFDGDAQRAPRLGLSFFGAFGPHGPLPTHLVQYIDDQRRHRGDATWIGFLDIFHHRLASLFYRAWANAQPVVGRDRPESDPFSHYLGALIGQNTATRARPANELDELSLFTATHFSTQTRHAEGLGKVLRACFGVAVEIEEFVGQWLEIPPQYTWVVPTSASLGEIGIGVLGHSTRVGTQVWDRTSKFRVIIGPVTLADYERFLPGGDHLTRLIELVQRYAGLELSWDIRLILRDCERRAAVLGRFGLLGRTANLGESDGHTEAFEELVFDPIAATAAGAQS